MLHSPLASHIRYWEAELNRSAWFAGDDFTAADDLMTAAAGCARLTEDEKNLLRMRYYDDMTQQRIAEQVGVSQMQVSRRLAAILAKIREGSAIAGAA